MISFSEVTKQVHLLNDIILSDMVCDNEDSAEDATSFSQHLLQTKYWFSRISWANKKRYVLALLEDVRSAWALSLLLKSLWNCRPKDAVLSACELPVLSCYDQVPFDHNRTAMPIFTLAQVMKTDRMWFLTLDSETQAMVLSELLTISGGPVMWAVLRRAQVLYERYRDLQMQNLQECIVLNNSSFPPATPKPSEQPVEKAVKKDVTDRKTSVLPVASKHQPAKAQRELEANLAAWNATIKSLRDSQKLEEVEMIFNDGTKKKMWKVNRPKPEAIETVDFLQLLPSALGKRVLSYLPRAQIGDYARVNKYWAYLVDEFKAELAARQKIDTDFEKMNSVMLRHDTSLELVEQINFLPARRSSQGNVSNALSLKLRPPASVKVSEKSAGIFSIRQFISEKANKHILIQKPIRKLADLTDRLDRRGAADENLWSWCDSILHHVKPELRKKQLASVGKEEGILPLENAHFPCPMMKHALKVPLSKPLYKDPATTPPVKPRKNISEAVTVPEQKEQDLKRYSLWTRDVSRLYPVLKIPSYQSPI